MQSLARGFIRPRETDSSDSEKRKKAEEGPTSTIDSFLAGDDKSIASIQRWRRDLFGGQPAGRVNGNRTQQRRPPSAVGHGRGGA